MLARCGRYASRRYTSLRIENGTAVRLLSGTSFLLAAILLPLLAIRGNAQEALNSGMPEAVVFKDIDGGAHYLPCKPVHRALVLVFINTECPIANAYHPKLRRLRTEFAEANFDFVMVHADASLDGEVALKHKKEYEIDWAVALDPGSQLARRVSAKVTPEAIIVDPNGKVLYRGRIDDLHQTYGKKRPEPTTDDLRMALKAVSENRAVPAPETKAVGCVIRYTD